ncbi:MAG: MFS transporter [Planctomycetota bacterium]|nr:MFS transporter [Planctomycetota bacterium]
MRSGNPRPRNKALGLVFLIVFLDIVGFSVIFPLFPAMLDHYVGLEGQESAVGRLLAQLRDLAGSEDFAVVVLFGGVLGSLYSLLQFLFAPLWGALSDRFGRRPILLLTLAGTVAGYVLWGFAGSFAILVAARLLGGAMAGNISTATAVVADVTEGRERAKGMGVVGMAIGLGFILGPALGGLLSRYELGQGEWTTGFALNPFSAPAFVSGALALVNLAWVAGGFPETLPPERRGKGAGAHTLNPFRRLSSLRTPGVPRTSVTYFLFLTAFSAMEFTLTFLAVERFAFTPVDNAWMFIYIGLIVAFVNGGVVRRMAPKLGEKRLILVGLAILVPAFVLMAYAGGSGMLYAGLAAMAVGSALAIPCLSALVSRYASAEEQGFVLGTFRSLGALSRAVGPVLGGVLYWTLGSSAPYLAGAAFLLLPLALAAGLPPVPRVPLVPPVPVDPEAPTVPTSEGR